MRPLRPWHLLLACLALAVPIQAGALPAGKGGGLAVSASLGECGVSGTGVVCRIDASWSGVEDATRYTATVTLADGSATGAGTVGGGAGGGSTSIWVPYVGSGIYTVSVTAWGSDEEGKDRKLEDEEAEAEIERDQPQAEAEDGAGEAEADQDGSAKGPKPEGDSRGSEGEPGNEQDAAEQPSPGEKPPAEQPPAEQPPADPQPAPEPADQAPERPAKPAEKVLERGPDPAALLPEPGG